MEHPLQEAIETFLEKQALVYRADPNRILRDARVAQRSAQDYRGRWLLELLQNCEDAQAPLVRLVARNNTIYVADRGRGFVPTAVEAISGSDFSDKPEGTIGRKGVGFKAVFEITENPQIFSKNNEGLEFNPQKAREWLIARDLPANEEIPLQWLPFSLKRDQAAAQDPVLSRLQGFATIIKLPLPPDLRAEEELADTWQELKPENFLPFTHLRVLQVVEEGRTWVWRWRKSGENPLDQTVCLIRIYKADRYSEQKWRLLRKKLKTPDHLLKSLPLQDRRHAQEISWLVAAPLEGGQVAPTEGYLPIQVFYPTQVPSPVPLLLHGEFLVNTERTAIIPEHPFNEWVAAKLAGMVAEFVQGCYQPEAPASFLQLLRPYDHLTAHDFTKKLWNEINTKAKEHLRLPDLEGVPRLRCREALVPPASELAHELLRHTDLRPRLIHQEVSQEEEVVEKVLKPLGVEIWESENLLHLLHEKGREYGREREWLWLAWQWLAEWVCETNIWSEERRERLERVRSLALLPVDGTLKSAAELKDRFITWKDKETPELPDWLPLAFLDSWFADKIKVVIRDKKNKLIELLGLGGSSDKNLGIKRPSRELWRQALEQAIEDFWQNPRGEESRFLAFLLAFGWHKAFEATERLKRCPIPVVRGGHQEFEEAGKAYFPADWGGDELLEQLWGDDPRIPWARPFVDRNRETQLKLYQWLGVNTFPKLGNEEDIKIEGLKRINEKYYDYVYNRTEGERKNIKIKHIEFTDLSSLNDEKGKVFLLLLIKNWEAYYEKNKMTLANHRPYRCWYDRSVSVEDYWWFQVKNELRVPVTHANFAGAPLSQCWLPDAQVQKILGEFLPVIDLEAFPEEYREKVLEWLRYEVRLRERLDQLKLEEWQEILQSLPRCYPAARCQSEEKSRIAVGAIYRTFLESSHDPADLREVIWLSRKGEEWDYREGCWLDDDENVAQAFSQDIWLLLHPGSGQEAKAARLPGVKRLSQHSHIKVLPGITLESQSREFHQILQEVIPFVYVWLRDQRKLEEKAREKLHTLTVKVVNSLRLKVSLEGVGEQIISKNWALDKNLIYLSEESLRNRTWQSDLSQGLANFLQRKADQEFYENLLRCESEEERRAKLRQKGVREEGIGMFLAEYHGTATPKPEPPSEPRSPLTSTGPTPASRMPAEKTGAGPSKELAGEPAPIQETPHQVNLVDPDKISTWHQIESTETSTIETDVSFSDPTLLREPFSGTSSLSQEERRKIERVSRQVCRRKLEDEGYEVVEMPEDHPGFDLKASKDGQTKLIEIKGHVGSVAKVEISLKQIMAYLKPEIHDGDRWELWNVEHLGENGRPPQIQIFTTLDLDQLEAKSFSVDLREQRPAEVWRGMIGNRLEN